MPIIAVPGVLKPPAGGASYTWSSTVGNATATYGVFPGTYGSLTPSTVEGVTFEFLIAFVSNSSIWLRFSGSQIGSATSIECDLEGYGTFTVNWNSSVSPNRYDTNIPALKDYLVAEDGNTLGFNLTDVTGGGNTPLGA